jgi:hypothetical protein
MCLSGSFKPDAFSSRYLPWRTTHAGNIAMAAAFVFVHKRLAKRRGCTGRKTGIDPEEGRRQS